MKDAQVLDGRFQELHLGEEVGREVITPSHKERWKLWGDAAAPSFNVHEPGSVKAMRSPEVDSDLPFSEDAPTQPFGHGS